MTTAPCPSPPAISARAVALAVLGALLATAHGGCAHSAPGSFVWIEDFRGPSDGAPGEYVIVPGDLLGIRVYNQDGMSAKVRVREDGKISVPFLNDVTAAGLTPPVLASTLQDALKPFLVKPIVTVVLEEPRACEVYVVGEVVKSGRYALEPRSTVLQALAAAGGINDYARRDRIFVVRQKPVPVRIRFRFESLTRIDGPAGAFPLRAGDVVVVE